jgi:hypothetical protein
MKTKDLRVVVVTAVVVMAVAVGLFEATPAVNAVGNKKPAAAQPMLDADGVRFTLTMDKPTYGPGEKPVLTLRAENTRDAAASPTITVRMMTARPSTAFSRMVPIPVSRWQTSPDIKLKPKETREYRLPVTQAAPAAPANLASSQQQRPKAAAPAGISVSFQLVSGKKVVTAAGYGLVPLKAQVFKALALGRITDRLRTLNGVAKADAVAPRR